VSRAELGYAFVPVPRWLWEKFERGVISEEAFRLHGLLYQRANFGSLMKRRETPRLRLETIANGLGAAPDAVRKLIGREKGRGHLDYRHEGSPRKGNVVWVFSLAVDGPPSLSAVSPAKKEAARPPNDASRDSTGSRLSEAGAERLSAEWEGEGTEPVPQNRGAVRRKGQADSSRGPGFTARASGACPESSDVREKPNFRRREDTLGRESLEGDQEVGEGIGDTVVDQLDQLFKDLTESDANPELLAAMTRGRNLGRRLASEGES
jgi:hypothetical protein